MGLAMMASCAQESDVTAVTEGQEIISLGALANGMVETRGVINDLEALSAEGDKVGIYGLATAATKATDILTADWTALPLMQNVQTTTIDKTTGMMAWTGTHTYPKASDTKQNVKFMAYYPYAAEGTGDDKVIAAGVSTAPKLNFTLDGSKDLMWATPVLGSRTAPASALKFNHKLTQFTFELKDTKGDFTTTKGVVQKVTINANTKGVMDMESGVISGWATPTDISVLKAEITTVPKDTPVALNTTTMLQAGQASFAVKLTCKLATETAVDLNGTIKPVGDTKFLEGKAYKITLGLSGDVLVQLAAEVIPWVEGGTGSGNME